MPPILPRARPYPVMAKNSLDYLPQYRYETAQTRHGNQGKSFFTIEHKVSNGNFVARLISEGRAAFACTLTSAHSIYREVFVENKSREIEHIQKLTWDEGRVRFPLLFQPAVVTLEEIKDYTLKSFVDGVHDIWSSSKVSFPKGAFLAIAPFWQSQSTLQSILRIRKAEPEELPEGCYEVKAAEEEGFYFEIKAHPKLFDSLHNCGDAFNHRDSLYAAAFAEGLGILSRDFKKEEEWINHHNLRALRKMLNDKKIKMWEEEEFSANRAVAKFHPHVINTGIDDND